MALDGDTALVGAPHDEDPNGDFSGAAYVFGRTGSGWGQRAKLAPDGGQPRENVGQSVALDGDTALVGTAPVEGTGANDPGGAYVFRRVDDGAGWRLRRTLAPDPSPEIRTLGAPVALAGDTALVGATVIENGTGSEDAVEAGGVYAYERTDDGWRRRARLPSADADRLPSPISSVALAGDAVVLGAGLEDTLNGRSTGAAHLFGRAGGAWTRRGALVAPDGDASDLFGAAVAADGSTVLVGTPGEEDPNGKLGGAVYAFERVAPAGAPPGPDVDDDGTPARDPNGDGRYEDVDGDGDVTADDVTVLFDATFERDAAVTDSVPLFDFNGDGSVRPGDATVLFEEVLGD